MEKFTPENWNYCQYRNEDLKAIISFGASPDILDDSFQYYITLLDDENNEVFQEEFESLSDACENINLKYSNFWDFTNLDKAKPEPGCSTCVAK